MKDEHAGELIDLYALGALEPGEQSAVDSHLDTCPACRVQLAESRRVVDLLAWTPEQRTPPPDLARKVRRRVEQLQLQRRPSAPRSTPRFFGLPSVSLRTALLAAALALLVVLGSWNVRLQRQVTALAAEAQQRQRVDEMLRASGVRFVTLEGQPAAPRARGSLVVNPQTTDGYLLADGLPLLPEDKTYQLWLAKGDSRANGGTFRPNEQGGAMVLIRAPERMNSYTGCGITVEPEGGSPGPTGERVLRSASWGGEGW